MERFKWSGIQISNGTIVQQAILYFHKMGSKYSPQVEVGPLSHHFLGVGNRPIYQGHVNGNTYMCIHRCVYIYINIYIPIYMYTLNEAAMIEMWNVFSTFYNF